MAYQEKRAWIMLIVSVTAYAAYVASILSRTDGHPLVQAHYVVPLLWTIGAATLASTVIETALGVANPKASRLTDVRDRQIGQLGEHTGRSFVIIGAVAAMLMAMAGWDQFWVANVIYLCFVLSAALSSITKIIAYRKTFLQW